ncbi:MAG: Npt1/Npt2 family nucleotide transporter [Simkaniaceae bacterium]
MTSESEPRFGKVRTLLWPIHRNELKKFLPMFLIYFLICINYSLLRAAKDALVITAPHSGAEAIPFIKVWAIVPMAILFTILFTRLVNRYGREKVFYIMISLFIGFYTLFALILYPCRDVLHPNNLATHLQGIAPDGFRGLIGIFRNWTFTLFYVMSELWSTMIMSVLFWGFTNEVTSVNKAKRFYGILLLGANIASIISGQISVLLSNELIYKWVPFGTDPWGKCILLITSIVTIVGLAIMALFYWLNRNVIDHEESHDLSVAAKKGPKIKMSFRNNIAYLSKSKYLIFIAVIVLTYNISINMIEVVWKDQVKELIPNPNDFAAYMGKIMMLMGALSTFVSIFLCGNLIRRFGWTFGALVAPFTMLVTGIVFFSVLLFKNAGLGGIAIALGTTPLALGVLFGGIQNCMARTCKYTLLDATKEMAFIPLSPESKLKGKAAIDGVGSRIGKSGGSIIHQCFLMIFGSISLSTPYVAGLLLIVIGIWIAAAKNLGQQFTELTAEGATSRTPAFSSEPQKQEVMG